MNTEMEKLKLKKSEIDNICLIDIRLNGNKRMLQMVSGGNHY